MGQAKKPRPVKLFLGMIAANEILLTQVEEIMSYKFGRIDFESPVLPFFYTTHYQKEMGRNLKRKFIAFEQLIDPGQIAEIKALTNQVEKKFLGGNSGKRKINLDPGYLSSSKLILVTTKNYFHRIYLNQGIYAEITLRFVRNKGFQPWEWTYPDYRSESYLRIFNEMRRRYQEQLRQMERGVQ